MDTVRRIFKYLNRIFIVPLYRMGLAWLLCNPISGYIMVIKNTGRRTGKRYHTPTNYAIIEGNLYCIAGFGRKSDWYLNLIANPRVEVMLPGRAIMGKVEEVDDREEALKVIKQVFKNAGFAGFIEGFNPWTAPDEKFSRTLNNAPVMRIRPAGIGGGPMDAGGWHWIPLAVLTLAVLAVFLN